MPSTEGLMARLVIYNDVVSGETSLTGQIFVFGGFLLRANLIGHLEQSNSYALVIRSVLEILSMSLISEET